MGKIRGGQVTRESRRELRRRQLRIWAYVGLGALAAATAVVVAMALGR